jgi:hypothetical protein
MIRPVSTAPGLAATDRELIEIAMARIERGLAPPAELYRIRSRAEIDWSLFPTWARPLDPEIFDGCCHEG